MALCRSTSHPCGWSGRDKASLHKVAGRTVARAISGHSTCQQSHRTPGTHSPLHWLPAFYFLCLFPSAHSFLYPGMAFPFIFHLLLLFFFFLPIPFTPHSPPLCFFGKVMHPTFLLPFGIMLKGRQSEQCCLKSLVVLIEYIILLMFCLCCCTLKREAQCSNIHTVCMHYTKCLRTKRCSKKLELYSYREQRRSV